ncbi:2-nitropropane dioxygenase [Mycena maculata]|uniref:2-nitropropane dioxygenase n=1 Tax=Mycena maculata TaxID=230809 RepID=A0AAD7N5X0_9AGAR|nr:2-nitropropane dioxygenase [Mycena maculata]
MSRPGLKLLNTKLTRLLGIKTPLVLPPMAGAAGGELAGQVSSAGGFGFLSAGYGATPDEFKRQLSLARAALKTPPSGYPFPVGVGYLAWQLEAPQSPVIELISVALEHDVQAVWFSFGEDLGRWIQLVRENDARRGKKTIIFVQISTVKEALVAVNEWKVDCIVAQGVESGGHGANYASPLLNLLPSILSSLPPNGPPILAAGGLANGAHLASVLTLGAAGAVLGTRFLLAYESLYSHAQRRALVAASSDLSAWDHARETLGWPAGIDGRGLRNSTVEDFEKGIDIEILKSKFREGLKNQDTDRIIVWAGTGVGQMNQIQTAKSIVEELHQDCIDHLAAVAEICS